MLERYNDGARRVLNLAQEQSREIGHDFIGTEHLLLALAVESAGVAARALREYGITVDKLRAQPQLRRAESDPGFEDLPYTPRARRALEYALRESLGLGHKYIGTEHLLIGLIRYDERTGEKSNAISILESLDISRAQLRASVLGMLSRADARKSAKKTRPRLTVGDLEEMIQELLLREGPLVASDVIELLCTGPQEPMVGRAIQAFEIDREFHLVPQASRGLGTEVSTESRQR